jgi:hypothetical protein
VVVAALFVFLIATNAIPLFGAKSSAGNALKYSEAAPIAAQGVSTYQGGGWALLVAAGLDSSSSEVLPVNSSSLSTSNCTFSLAPGAPATITVPAYTGNRSAGLAPAWEFLYRDGAGTVALVLVVDGQATVFGTIGGVFCTSLFGLFSAVPSSVIDSSQAAGAVAANATTFFNQHPDANATFGLLGGVSFFGKSVGPEWTLKFSTCAFAVSPTGTGAEFNATVSATSGAVIYSETRASVPCGS